MTSSPPKFCGRCGSDLPSSLICKRCGSDSTGWSEWVPIGVCMGCGDGPVSRHTHEWVVSPYHEVVICTSCGEERIEPQPRVEAQVYGHPSSGLIRFINRRIRTWEMHP